MTEYCGKCAEPLQELPLGVRAACCVEPDPLTGIKYSSYWSPLAPLPGDASSFRQVTGLDVKKRVIDGVTHYLYRSPT